MSVEGWVRWFRSRTAWIWTIAFAILTFVCLWMNRSRSDFDFYIDYGGDIELPAHLPFSLHTHAQRVAYARFLPVLWVMVPLLMYLTVVLLVGVLWSRAIRSARLAFLPMLLALLAAMLQLAKEVIDSSCTALLPDPPFWLIELNLTMNPWCRRAFHGVLCLAAVGAVALLIRAFRVHVLRTAEPLSSQTE